MSKQHHRSYDDLVRQDVPLPDSSFRPSRDEVDEAHARKPGPTIVTDIELTSVRAALLTLEGADLTDLNLQIEDGRARVDGSVATAEDRRRIVAAVEMLPGVVAVIDTLRVRL